LSDKFKILIAAGNMQQRYLLQGYEKKCPWGMESNIFHIHILIFILSSTKRDAILRKKGHQLSQEKSPGAHALKNRYLL
jgi:hypothetical protein